MSAWQVSGTEKNVRSKFIPVNVNRHFGLLLILDKFMHQSVFSTESAWSMKRRTQSHKDELTLGKQDILTILKAAETQPILVTAALPALLLLYWCIIN